MSAALASLVAAAVFGTVPVSPNPEAPRYAVELQPASSATSGLGEQRAPTDARNALYLELGGNGLVSSVNFDRMVTEHLAVRGGLGYAPKGVLSDGDYMSSLLMMSALIGSGDNRLELGAGPVLVERLSTRTPPPIIDLGGPYIGTVIGFRHAPKEGGFMFRAGVTPMFYDGLVPILWAGASGGLQF